MVHFEHENVSFWVHVLFQGSFSFISSSILRNTSNGFLHKSLLQNSCYLSIDNVFSTNLYVFTHLCLFEWKISFICFLWNHINGTLHIELKWDNEFTCNIWWNISSSLVIVWMVFEVYLHFVIYHDNYNFLTNIIFNQLISISKWVHSWLGYHNRNHDTRLS
jgi:hypothetical protein